MKILIVNTDLDIGGGENSLVSFLNNFDLEKYSVDLGLLQPKFGMIDRIDKRINLIKLYEKPQLSEYDVAIGYKQGKSTNFVASKVSAKKKISIFRHGSIKYTGIRKFIYGNQYKKFDYIITLNEDLREKFSKHFNIDINKIKIIKDLFDKEETIEKANEFEVKRDGDLIISTVSRIVPVKNIGIIPKIANVIKSQGIDFKWYVIGEAKDKKYLNNILKEVKEYNLEENIIFTGELDNPMPYIKASDIYAHPSFVESWCRSITDALMLKVFVLSLDTIGAKAQIINGVNGQILFGNGMEMSDCIISLYESHELKKIKENQPEFEQDNKEVMEEYYKLFV